MNSDKFQKFYKVVMLIILTALITFIITTVVIKKEQNSSNIKYISVNTSDIGVKLAYYKDFIEKNYLYDIDEEKMKEYAIRGYFAGLEDEYCEYISKEEMDEYMSQTIGKYVGIGVYIYNNKETNQIVVLAPMKGSPAEEVGIKPGDIILKVDGIEYKGEQLNEASSKLKSEEGTKVKVQIQRDDEILDLEIERRSIKLNHLESKTLENDIGYIKISSFDEGCYDEFLDNYKNLKEKNIKSLIIDLRNNGGGIVDEATNIADLFVEKGKTLLITKSKKIDEKLTLSKKDKEIDLPTIILVNGTTASSSEILTLAIKENNDNVKVVGTRTYGKGVIQSVFKLQDGGGVKLTTEEYLSPNHNSINKEGIAPDYRIELPEDFNSSLLMLLEEKDDTQLQRAIEVLNNNNNN